MKPIAAQRYALELTFHFGDTWEAEGASRVARA